MAKRVGNKLPPFVAMTWKTLNSKAYMDLNSSSAKALPFFIGKVKEFGFNDPARFEASFEFTYTEASKRLGFGRSTFYGIIKDLMKKGFIDPVKKGGLRSFGNTSSRFKLSKRWENYGTAFFREVTWETFGDLKNHPLVLSMDNNVPITGQAENL